MSLLHVPIVTSPKCNVRLSRSGASNLYSDGVCRCDQEARDREPEGCADPEDERELHGPAKTSGVHRVVDVCDGCPGGASSSSLQQ